MTSLIILLVGLLVGPVHVDRDSTVIAAIAQSRRSAQKSERDLGSGIDYVISANAMVILGPHHARRVLVYAAPQEFTLENIRTIFLHLSEKYPSEDLLWIDAVSNKRKLREINDWFAAIESFSFGDVAPVGCGTKLESAPLSAHYYRGTAIEYFVYYSASGESIPVDLKRWYYGCDEPDASEPDLLDATILNCKEPVRRLLDSGVDPSVKSRQGGAPVFEAAYWKHEEILKLLLDRGADINQRSSSGWTALIAAAVRDSRSIVEMLLSRGADINVRSEEGQTALIHAVIKQNAAVVRMLLARGADVTIRDGYGKTALAIAEEQHDKSIARILREAGAKR